MNSKNILSEKLKPLRVVNNYKFRFYRTLANDVQRWVCCKKTCNAAIKYDVNGAICEQNTTHNHEPDDLQSILRQKVSNSVKRKAVEQFSERPSKIIHSEMSSTALSVLDSNDISLIRKNIHTARMNIYPKLPRDFPQLHATLPDVINKIQTKNNEKWIFINDVQNNIVCFTTQINLDFLKQCDSIFMDGTFSSCPFPFKQLFVIHGFKNSSYIPLFFSLLPSKCHNAYKTVLDHLKNHLCDYIPNRVFSDFEQAIHTTIQDVWPTTNLKASRFHQGQAWFRKMQSLGLAKPNMKPGEMSEYLKLFFGLPFLRPDEVDDCFVTDIMALLPPNNSKLTAFTDYILEVYVREDSRYPPSLWAECSSSITRTTNACESFHSKLNSMFYHSHPNIFIFIDALNEIQTNGYLKMNCTKTSRVNKISIEKEHFLAQQIQYYEEGEINRLEYLKSISFKFIPTKF